MALVLEDLTVLHGRRAAVSGLWLEVPDGCCTGFLGHNGAGKTTTLRASLGLLPSARGRVLVDGFEVLRRPLEARARVGALIEICRFQEGLGGWRNLVELARLGGLDRAAARREASLRLEQVGLGEAADLAVRAYSQGMRQRLGIAQALLGSPGTLLLDEPTNGLDPEGIAEIRALVRDLVEREGKAVLLSSHLLNEVADACDRIAVLRQGVLVVEGETHALLALGRTRYRYEAEDAARAAASLAELGLAPEPGAVGHEVDLHLLPPAQVARALVESGAGLVAFAPAEQGLEAFYLRASRGELAAPAPAAPRAEREPGTVLAPRRPLARLLGYEARRLARAGTPLWLLAPALLGAVAVLRRAAEARAVAAEVEAGQLASATDLSAFEALGRGWLAGLPLLVLMGAGLASQLIAAEHARGTLRSVLLRPVGRQRIACGKALVAAGAMLFGYAALVGVTWLLAASQAEFGDVVELLPNGQRFPIVPADELAPELLGALLGVIPALLAFAALGLAVGALARSAAGALAASLGLVATLDLLRGFAREGGWESWLPGAYLPSVLGDASRVRAYALLAEGVTNVRFEHAATELTVPLAWTALALAVTLLALHRKPLP